MQYNEKKIRAYIDVEHGLLPTSVTWLWDMTTVPERNEALNDFIIDQGIGPDGNPAKYDDVHFNERKKLLGDQFEIWLQGNGEVSEEYIKTRGVAWVIANIGWLDQLGVINIDQMR